MTSKYRIHIILIPILISIFTIIGLFGTLRPFSHAAPLAPETVEPGEVFSHLDRENRLHWVSDAISTSTGTFVAPDGDWTGGAGVINAPTDPISQAYALRMETVALYRTSVQDELGQDIAWETADFLSTLHDDWNNSLPTTLLTDTQITSDTLADIDILLLPSFTIGYADEVEAALGTEGLAAIAEFVTNGGTVYAQGQAQFLLEATGILPADTVDLDTPLQLPASADDLGTLLIEDSSHPLGFNLADDLLLLNDPTLHVDESMQVVASYMNTVSGVEPAVVNGRFHQGQYILINGHPTSALYRDQQTLFFNGLLWGMAERGELYGRAIQTYDGNVPPDLIPAYEAGLPISTTLHFDNLWQGVTLTDIVVEERVQAGFTVLTDTIQPPPDSIIINKGNDVTGTIITWNVSDADFGSIDFAYIALTELDALAPGTVTFSTGSATYTDTDKAVIWAHPDFTLNSAMAARLEGEHDNEPDRFYTIPEEGLYLDEFAYLENKEHSLASNVRAGRYIPLIVPIVGLENQREPLATNAGETVWMKNELFVYDDDRYITPIGMTSYTETWGIDQWDGTTFVTMTTPNGYHIDPIQPNTLNSIPTGFFVTIPPTYSHMITVTENFELRLPAIYVEWELGDFPGYWYEMPAVRYGIHSTELFDRPVSFTGDPFVDTVVVDATGGSVYTGSGTDPLIYREYLAPVEVHPPTPPMTTSVTYQDIWSRTHELPLRANFYDVFNFASCGGCGGNSERHAALNVTFGIWVDLDDDGENETLITDFDEMKGIMPTRLSGDLDIFIKSRNLGTAIAPDENIIDGSIFRGLGFGIFPRYDNWDDSWTSAYSVLSDTVREGGYDHLIFQQAVPAGETDLITIHATFDPTASPIEGMMKLHDGVRFVYRQNYAGSGQYEVNDTHVQGVVGARSDVEIENRVSPSVVSTYGDTLFKFYDLADEHDPRLFSEDPYLMSWGYGDLAATTYVGGRDKKELLHSLITLGDHTWIRVEVNNNSGVALENVTLTPQPPAGITITNIYTDPAQIPVPMWPDLPFMNLETIPDAGFGIYYFELQSDETMTDLLGTVLQIPIAFSANNAPAAFELPPAILAIHDADGATPEHVYSPATNLTVTDELMPAMSLLDMRVLTKDEADMLRQWILTDTAVIPNTDHAADYFNSISRTVPYTVVDQMFKAAVPLTQFPELGGEGLHLATHEAISVTRATRHQINTGGVLDYRDAFTQPLSDTAPALFVEAHGAALTASYSTGTITRTSTGENLDYLFVTEWNEAELGLTILNSGTDIAANTVITVVISPEFEIIDYPDSMTPIPEGLVWTVGALAPGASRQVTIVAQVQPDYPPSNMLNAGIILGNMEAIDQTNGRFVNVYSGQAIQAQVGANWLLPVGYEAGQFPGYHTYLPLITNRFVTAPDLVVESVARSGDGIAVVIKNQGNATITAKDGFWVDVYVNPSQVPTAVNHIWNEGYGSYGVVWNVETDIAPGDTVELTIGDGYYSSGRTVLPESWVAGTAVYAQVDSYNLATAYGAIQENHELENGTYNNILGPVILP